MLFIVIMLLANKYLRSLTRSPVLNKYSFAVLSNTPVDKDVSNVAITLFSKTSLLNIPSSIIHMMQLSLELEVLD